MKKYMTFILVGTVVVLAAVLVGVLAFMKNQPPQQRAFQPVVDIKPMEPDSSIWGQNFPNQWSSFQKTATNSVDTTYGGSSQFSWLKRDQYNRANPLNKIIQPLEYYNGEPPAGLPAIRFETGYFLKT